MCAAVDVYYLRTGGAVLASDAVFAHVLAERIAVIPQIPPYRPGEFYLRELPPLRAATSSEMVYGMATSRPIPI